MRGERDTARRPRRASGGDGTAFYDEPDAGIQDVVEWHAGHADEPAWSRAAGVYVRMLSTPQLFIEGNHRTGVLVMSHILMSAGRPPVVLSVANARAYFEASTALRNTHKNSPVALFRLPSIRRRLAALLQDPDDWSNLLRRWGGLGCGDAGPGRFQLGLAAAPGQPAKPLNGVQGLRVRSHGSSAPP